MQNQADVLLIPVKFVIVDMCQIFVFIAFCLAQQIQGYLSFIAHLQNTRNKQWTFPEYILQYKYTIANQHLSHL